MSSNTKLKSENYTDAVAYQLRKRIQNRKIRVGIIGLGYVGLPLAIRLEFKDEQRPEVFLKFCENYQFTDTTFPGIAWLEKTQIDLLDKLSNSIVHQEKGKILLQGSRSINKTLDSIQNRVSN